LNGINEYIIITTMFVGITIVLFGLILSRLIGLRVRDQRRSTKDKV